MKKLRITGSDVYKRKAGKLKCNDPKNKGEDTSLNNSLNILYHNINFKQY